MPSLKAPEDARIDIEAAWHEWKRRGGFQPSDVLTGTEGFAFFLYLESHRPDLLDFKYQGDKWQIVHSWLLQDGQVKD
jgi:hypothetical protein